MNVSDILSTVEKTIQTPQEREYFLIHEERYHIILGHLSSLENQKEKPNNDALRGTQSQNPRQKKGLRILDVGCFPYHLGAALELMGHDVYGISSSHEPIKSKKIAICNIEKDTFPFKDNFFDVVLCTEVLEHLPQSPAFTLREARRVTMPQGHILITTPNIARSINRLKLLIGKSVMYPLEQILENDGAGSNLYHRHNREYTLGELVRLISREKWKIETATHFVSYTPMRRRIKPDPLWLKAGKTGNYALMMLASSLRDTLLVIGKKGK